jgi:hypothetical protein
LCTDSGGAAHPNPYTNAVGREAIMQLDAGLVEPGPAHLAVVAHAAGPNGLRTLSG